MIKEDFNFYPLNVLSEYSLLESALKIEDYIAKLKLFNYKGGAIADLNHTYGYGPFSVQMKKNNLKSIYGLTLDISLNDEIIKVSFYIKNNDGYKNILKIVNSIDLTEPLKVDSYELKGLIAVIHTSSITKIDLYKNLIYKLSNKVDNLYLGLEIYNQDDITKANLIRDFVKVYPYKLIAFPNILYANKKDHEAYQILNAIKEKSTIESLNQEGPYFILSPKALGVLYSNEEINNTVEIANDCTFNFLDIKGHMLKFYQEQKESDNKLRQLAFENANKLNLSSDVYLKRIEKELNIISKMGYSDYFLIVSDYINYAKSIGILVGPGRGSAAGSLVSYVLGITEIDPLKFNLSFERFLNPLRVTMPDIDVDIEEERRIEVIDYIKRRYGEDKVANIVTFNTIKLKSSIRNVGDVLKYIPARVDTLAKSIAKNSKSTNFEEEAKNNYSFNKLLSDKYYQNIVSKANKIVGFPTNTSIHAAGIILSNTPLNESIEFKNGIVNQEFSYLEQLGFLKMDILSLSNLTFIKNIRNYIKELGYKDINISENLNDQKSYEILNKGMTLGIFQLESYGINEAIKQIKPTCFNDLVALLALFRPGPMANIPIYAKRKEENKIPSSGYKALDNELKETYGIIIYQEQIIRIAQIVAKFEPGKADLLRRAISKKDTSKMMALKEEFINGSINNGYQKSDAENIYNLILKFSNYGFNKSHSVSYSMISLLLLYYKAHYPLAFYSALLETTSTSDKNFIKLIREARYFGIKIKNPDINISNSSKPVILDNCIYLPFKTISGINKGVYESLVANRNDKYCSLSNVIVNLRKSNSLDINSFKSLINAGVFDSFGYTRGGLIESCPQLIQDSEYMLGDETLDIKRSDDKVKNLIREKDTLGVCLSIKIKDLITTKEGYIPLIITKEEIKTSTGYVNFVTDGYNEYRIISSKPQGLTTYDKILVSGNIDRNTNRITNASIIKEK